MAAHTVSFGRKVNVIAWVTCWLVALSAVEAGADILFRDTFENIPSWDPWTENYAGSGRVQRDRESDDPYQTQAHGALCYHIYDPDDSSYANARHDCPLTGTPDPSPEYMVEFYYWYPQHNGQYVEACSLRLYAATRAGSPADIWLLLDVWPTDGKHPPSRVVVRDSSGYHTLNRGFYAADEWHRLQIHKLDNSSVVNLWIDGDSIGTYTSLSSTFPPDTFLFGTVDTLQNGEGGDLACSSQTGLSAVFLAEMM